MLEANVTEIMFPTYLQSYDFPQFEQYEPVWSELIRGEKYYGPSYKPTLDLTTPNLHKEAIFKPLVDFAQEAFESSMDYLGYKPLVQITSCWGTKQPDGGFHHMHSHGNCFLAGVFYLSGQGENIPGTTYFNSSFAPSMVVNPALNGKTPAFQQYHTTLFKPGRLVIFPAWVPHFTNRKEGGERLIIGFNTMPYGPTNADIYDRFHYKQVDSTEMINERNERYT